MVTVTRGMPSHTTHTTATPGLLQASRPDFTAQPQLQPPPQRECENAHTQSLEASGHLRSPSCVFSTPSAFVSPCSEPPSHSALWGLPNSWVAVSHTILSSQARESVIRPDLWFPEHHNPFDEHRNGRICDRSSKRQPAIIQNHLRRDSRSSWLWACLWRVSRLLTEVGSPDLPKWR